MELWVRSQFKEFLIKVNDLRIMQLTEDGFEIGEKTDDWFIVANDDPCVGKYKSKERALQILDEIQNSILGILSLKDIEEQETKKYTGKATFSKVTKQLVYIMPEE